MAIATHAARRDADIVCGDRQINVGGDLNRRLNGFMFKKDKGKEGVCQRHGVHEVSRREAKRAVLSKANCIENWKGLYGQMGWNS
ncbi:MAG: hypothetical protein AAGD25_26405 [Cyanobacteria bacterium P01_F01_bin.150]